LTKCIIPNRDVFYIDYEEAKQITGYSADNIIRTGLSSLVEQGIIARSRNPYKYYINPLVVFNGDRITFAETYIKRKSDSKSFINSKLNNNE
jgi:predicted transcriptional regulator of viral defense system